MNKCVNLTYVIRNDADLTFYRTENQMTNLVALYRKFDTLRFDPGPIRDVRYGMSPTSDMDDILNIDLDVTDMDEVTVLRQAHVFADVLDEVRSISINRSDITNMFVGLEIAMRMTAESRAHFADRIKYCCVCTTDQVVRSMDTPDGTIFYIWNKKTDRPMRDINVDGIWDEFLSELENVYDLDSEDRPMMKYVVMNCQCIPQITKASL
ncbi:hypothetical protein [uncultured Bifidobacterium sp.]|uniref:hypothetical protein n=1 Tax=uncultured Bifidobacterium sp. TaxID=165187 RepID=UPI0025990307|nr:hypothetical protein [uncultured Bifidobacterium sp.]